VTSSLLCGIFAVAAIKLFAATLLVQLPLRREWRITSDLPQSVRESPNALAGTRYVILLVLW
jgi:hypothetical protein